MAQAIQKLVDRETIVKVTTVDDFEYSNYVITDYDGVFISLHVADGEGVPKFAIIPMASVVSIEWGFHKDSDSPQES
jgi:hypothetical protein